MFCQRISQLHELLTYFPNINHICHKNLPLWHSVTKPQQTNEHMREDINHYTNKWTYERKHKSLYTYSLVKYNKIYPNTNSWKILQKESLWQEDFDNLYFLNTLNKTHHNILVWNRNKRLHTSNKKHVHKERKEITHISGRWKKNTHPHIKKNKYNVYQ